MRDQKTDLNKSIICPPKKVRADGRRREAAVADNRGNVVFLRPGVVRRERRDPDAAA